MISATAFTQPVLQAQLSFQTCGWVGDICRAIHDVAMKVIQSICDCFRSLPIFVGATSLNSRVTVSGPLNLVSFYRGLELNNNGVTLDQILGWDDAHLESAHNYIQWLFPLTTPSAPNPTAPILDGATIQAFCGDAPLKNQVLRSFRRMLMFYGLQMDEGTKIITRAPNFNARAAVWLTPANHNFLRITRMIRSMSHLGLSDYSKSFFNILQNIHGNEGQGIISAPTFNFWRAACPT
jgi:hypothetical protein